jgi:hypothetical protein
MTLNQNINSNILQQFQKLWERMAEINTHIALVNKEIEVVKTHIQELIGIDVSNLTTFEDLSNLEFNLKQYTDESIDSIPQPDLTDYATKDEIPDLSDYLTKNEMYYEGDPTKDIRIKYNSIPVDAYNHENNIYIGGNYDSSTLVDDYQNVVIGHGAKSGMFKNVLIGNSVQATKGHSTILGHKAKGAAHSVAIGSAAQANGTCSIAIGSNCVNSTDYHIKFWAGATTTISALTGVQFGNIIFGISDSNLSPFSA